MGRRRGPSWSIQYRRGTEHRTEDPAPDSHFFEHGYLGAVFLLWEGKMFPNFALDIWRLTGI